MTDNLDTNKDIDVIDEEQELKTYTQEEVDKLLQSEADKRVSEALQTAKNKWKKEYDDELEKKKQEAEEYAEMTAKERFQHDKKKLEDELAEYKRKDTLNEMTKTARNVLAESNITISDDMLSILITEEAESTKANVDNFISLFKQEVDKAVTDKLKGSTPKKMGVSGLTKEEILKIPDPVERVQKIQENIDLFD